MKVDLRLNLEFQLENLDSLRPFQDWPRRFEVIKRICNHDFGKKLSNNESLGVNFLISQKSFEYVF